MVVEASGGGRARGVTLLDERAAVARLVGVKRQIRVRVRVKVRVGVRVGVGVRVS